MIGGLLISTVATLFFVPVVFALIRSRSAGKKGVPVPVDSGNCAQRPEPALSLPAAQH